MKTFKTLFQLSASFIFLINLAGCATTSYQSSIGSVSKNSDTLRVNLQNGHATDPKTMLTENLSGVTQLEIQNGECKKIALKTAPTPIPLEVCYRGPIFYLDAKDMLSIVSTKKSVQFRRIPLWSQGFSYRGINTRGPAQLSGVDVQITQISPPKDAS